MKKYKISKSNLFSENQSTKQKDKETEKLNNELRLEKNLKIIDRVARCGMLGGVCFLIFTQYIISFSKKYLGVNKESLNNKNVRIGGCIVTGITGGYLLLRKLLSKSEKEKDDKMSENFKF